MDHILRITSRHLGSALLPKLQHSCRRPLSISPCLHNRALHPCPAFCRISIRNHWNGRWENSKSQRWWPLCVRLHQPQGPTSLFSETRELQAKYIHVNTSAPCCICYIRHLLSPTSLPLGHLVLLEPWLWQPVGRSPQRVLIFCRAHIFCLNAFLPSSGKTRSGTSPVIQKHVWFWKCEEFTPHGPNHDQWEACQGYVLCPSVSWADNSEYIPSALQRSQRAEPHGLWFSGPWIPLSLAFLPSLFLLPSPHFFSLGSLPERTTLKLLLCTNVILLLFSH